MKKFVCDECDAEFTVHYDLDEDFYEVHFCPFCSAQIDKEIEEEARRQAEELIRQQEAEKQRLLEEQQAKEAAEREAEEKARREEEAAKAKPEPILLEEDGSPVGHARFIELLQDMKLSSERREAISQSPKQSCQIHVSSVEKTLMGQGPMKNGMTVIGTLSENRDIEVELQLPSEANEEVQAFQSNHSLEVVAQIINWNVGRKRAVFTATDFDYSYKASGNNDSLYLLGSFIDLRDFRVSEESLNREFFGVAVSTVDLNCTL